MYWDVLVGKAWKTIKFDGVFCCRFFFKRLSRLGILRVLQFRKPTIFWLFFPGGKTPVLQAAATTPKEGSVHFG